MYRFVYVSFILVTIYICVRCVYTTMIVARICWCSQMQLSMYDGTININTRLILNIWYWIGSRTLQRVHLARAPASNMRIGIYASACTWNAVNNAFIVCASRPTQLGSWDFFSDDDDEVKGRTEGRVQRFGISTFYADSALMNSCWW